MYSTSTPHPAQGRPRHPPAQAGPGHIEAGRLCQGVQGPADLRLHPPPAGPADNSWQEGVSLAPGAGHGRGEPEGGQGRAEVQGGEGDNRDPGLLPTAVSMNQFVFLTIVPSPQV